MRKIEKVMCLDLKKYIMYNFCPNQFGMRDTRGKFDWCGIEPEAEECKQCKSKCLCRKNKKEHKYGCEECWNKLNIKD